MAAVLHPPPIRRTGSGILINPLLMPINPISDSKRFSNTPSNNSLASSSSSSGNNTDDTSNSHQSGSQSWSGAGAQLQNSVALSRSTRSSSSPSTRKIRFAPLPDPRALEDAEAEADCDEYGGAPVQGDNIYSNLDSSDACSSLSSSLVSSLPISSSTSKESSCCSSGDANCSPPCDSNANTASTAVNPQPNADSLAHASGSSSTINKVSSGWISGPRKLLKPFLRRSSLPMPPASSSGITAEDILTLGTINLFRTSSPESRNAPSESSTEDVSESSSGGGWGSPLSRWTSTSTYSGQKNKTKEWLGSPLARTESTQSYKGDVRGRASQRRPNTASGSSGKASSSTPTQASQNRKSRLKGTKMLNGRVYGGRRIDAQNTNMFASVKDEDPEFVEWGYGGMGSVKAGAHGGSQWSRLQSDKAMSLVDAEEDDGGGMGWVKKRKEQREKLKKEAEEKAKQEAKAKASGAKTKEPEATKDTGDVLAQTQSVPSPESESAARDPTEPLRLPAEELAAKDENPVPAPVSPPIDEVAPPATPAASSNQEEHRITTACVTVPVIHRRTSHHRSNSANMSQTSSMHLVGLEGERERTVSPLRVSSIDVDEDDVEETAVKGKQIDADQSSDSSSSSSGSDSEGGDDEDDDDDEAEDEDEAEQIRKTALGAGVEKISRHKDER